MKHVPHVPGRECAACAADDARPMHFSHPLDALTRELTAFNSFSELVNAAGQYRPTILPRDARHIDLADAYDAFQSELGDPRRAYRGSHGQTSLIAPQSPEGFLSLRLHGVPAGSGLASEWQRVIWTINTAARARGEDLLIGSPAESYHPNGDTTRWVEEYPDFRVILRYTEWQSGENSGTIECKHVRAASWLLDAVADVAGRVPVASRHPERCCFNRCTNAATHKLGSEVYFPVCEEHFASTRS